MNSTVRKMRVGLSVVIILLFVANRASAQDIGSLVSSGVADGNSFLQAYMRPLGQSFGAGMNTGWYNTARAHKTLGISITTFVSIAQVPSADQSFDINSLGLQNARLASGSNITPTLSGANANGPLMDILGPNPFFNVATSATFASYPQPIRNAVQNLTVPGFTQTLGNIDRIPLSLLASGSPLTGSINSQFQLAGGSYTGVQQSLTQFRMPPGLGVPVLPALGGIQASIGIIKDIDLIVRFLPPLSFPIGGVVNRLDIGYWGVGAKLGFKQWIPGFKELPFDLAFVGGFTNLTSSVGLTLNPAPGVAGPTGIDYSNQKVTLNTTGFNAGVVISKKLLFFTPYAGIRFERATTTLKATGNYPITGADLTLVGVQATLTPRIFVLTDPVNISYSNPNSIAFNAGFRLKFLWVLTLHADYTFANYSVINTGLGIDIRERK